MKKPGARLQDYGDGGFSMETPYVEKFVEEFKESIPAQDRMWDRDSKRWLVDSDWYVEVLHLMSHYFEPIIVCDEVGTPRYRVSSNGIQDA